METVSAVRKGGRPKGRKNGEGMGVSRRNGGATKDFAPSTATMLRLQRPQTIEDLQAIVDNGLLCTYCQADMTYLPWMRVTIDHLVPVSTGGANNMSNLISACMKCNKSKSDEFGAIEFAKIMSIARNRPATFEAAKVSIAAQTTTKINNELGRIVVQAWRELTAEMTTNEERATVTLWMLVKRATEVARDTIDLRKAA